MGSRVWTTKAFWVDTFERVASTTLQVALGVVVAGGLVALSVSGSWAIIGTAAATSLLKALVAGFVIDSNVGPASLVPGGAVSETEANEG